MFSRLILAPIFFCSLALSMPSKGMGPDEGFYTPENLPRKHTPEGLTRARSATVQLMDDFEPSCTGSVISDHGYVLTAGHCISDCLLEKGMITQVSGKNPDYELMTITRQKPGVICEKIRIPALGGTDPAVIYAGRGFSGFDDTRILEIPDKIFKQMLENQDDFAILKFSFPEPVTCLPAARTPETQPGAPVWAIGFPMKTTRSPGLESDGANQFISFGQVYSDLSQNQYFLESHFSSAIFARARQFYDLPNQMIDNMDTVSGNSGSPMINQNGELIGVVTAGAVANSTLSEKKFWDGTSISIRLRSIREEINQGLGKEKTEDIFHCPH